MIQDHRLYNPSNRPYVPKKFGKDEESTVDNFESHLADLGIDPSEAVDRARSRSRSASASRMGRKRERSESMDPSYVDQANKLQRTASMTPKPGVEGLRDIKQKIKANKLKMRALKPLGQQHKGGEADRAIPSLMPKHLFSGKRTIGKTTRR